MNKLTKIMASLVVATIFGTVSAADTDYKLTLKLSHVFTPEEQLTISIDKVAESIKKKTNGAIDIQTFPNGQLPTYKDGLEQVVRGANFISVEDPSYPGDYIPDFKALVGPMLYQTYDEYIAMVKTDLVKKMVKDAEAKGIKILALDYIFGFRNVITNKVIKTPADLKGIKLRTPGSKLFIDTLNAMGATAVPLPFSETLSAVQQGVVDGLEGSEFTNLQTKVYELQTKNVALTGHFLGTCGVYISTEVWNKIPANYQKIIQEEFTAGANEMNNLLKTQYAGVVKDLESKGVKFNKVDQEAFTKATAKIFKEIPDLTPGVYDNIIKELKIIREKSK